MCSSEIDCHMAFTGCEPKLHPPTCASFSFSHILTNPSWLCVLELWGPWIKCLELMHKKRLKKGISLKYLIYSTSDQPPKLQSFLGWGGGAVQDSCRVFQHLHLPWPPAPCWRSHSSAQTLRMTSHLSEHRANIFTRVWSPQPPCPPLLTAPQPHWPAGSSCTPSALPSRPRLGGPSSWDNPFPDVWKACSPPPITSWHKCHWFTEVFVEHFI